MEQVIDFCQNYQLFVSWSIALAVIFGVLLFIKGLQEERAEANSQNGSRLVLEGLTDIEPAQKPKSVKLMRKARRPGWRTLKRKRNRDRRRRVRDNRWLMRRR